MAGKGNRDYSIHVKTDDPSMLDRLPEADTGWEATMTVKGSMDSWRKTGEPTRRGSTADAANQGGRVLDEEG